MQFSLAQFPTNGSLKDSGGLPWGCCIQPFYEIAVEGGINERRPEITADVIARCEKCLAYINPFAIFQRNKWKCPLCNKSNYLSGNSRYSSLVTRSLLPELKQNFVEYQQILDSDSAIVVILAVVDVTDRASLEVIKKGLLAAVEALPDYCSFGLITFSEEIGIYNLNSPYPYVLHTNIASNAGQQVQLHQLINPSSAFALVGDKKSTIVAAIESLQQCYCCGSLQRSTGTAITYIIDYLLMNSIDHVRMMLFLCGLPNCGPGSFQESIASARGSTKTPQSLFFAEQATRASANGICIDTFVITNQTVGLSAIKCLSLMSGGNVALYESSEAASLPQDIFRQFRQPLAFKGLLRIRTSPDFKAVQSLDYLCSDEMYENLYHLGGCDQFKTYTFDFQFVSPSGFSGSGETKATIQLAFAYTLMSPNASGLSRRLRVYSLQVPIAETLQDLYQGANADCILSVLTHKIIRSSLEEGILEARLLLQDWLTIFLTNYNKNMILPTKKGRNFDTTFNSYSNLKSLPRLVFALLKNPILSIENPTDPDYWSYLQVLYSGLDPKFLHKAIYPALSSYGNFNNLSSQNLYLSHTAISSSGCRLFLMDAYSLIIIYYAKTDSQDTIELPFPPPTDCLIKATVHQLKQGRNYTPKIMAVKHGNPEESIFHALLLEEESSKGPSYAQFLEFVQAESTRLQ